MRYGLQAALLGLVVAGLWLSHTTWRLHNDVVQIRGQQQVFQAEKQQLKLELEQQRQRSRQLEQQLATVEAKNKPNTEQVPQLNQPSLIAFALTPGMLRESGALKKLRIPSRTSLVELKLDVGRNSYATYRAVLLDDKGSEVWALNRARESRSGALSYVLVILPTTVLEPGDYSLKLSGITQGGELEPAGLYYFRVLPN